MNRALLGGASLLVLATVSAAAADRAVRAPGVAAAKQYNWTGFYAGAHVGGLFELNKSRFNYAPLGFGSGGASPFDFGGSGGVSNAFGTLGDSGSGGPFGMLTPPQTGYTQLSSLTYLAPLAFGGGFGGFSGSGGFALPASPFGVASAPDQLGGRRTGIAGAGVELGYNHQSGNLVVGFAADATAFGKSPVDRWSSAADYTVLGFDSGSGGSFNNINVGSLVGQHNLEGSLQVNNQWLSTLRLKAGFAQDRFMMYATGGLAVGRVEMKSSLVSNDSVSFSSGTIGSGGSGGPSGTLSSGTGNWNGSKSSTRTGFAAGGGVEYAVSNNWSLKAEGLYYDLGTMKMNVAGQGTYNVSDFFGGSAGSGSAPVSDYTVQKKINGVLVKVGVNARW